MMKVLNKNKKKYKKHKIHLIIERMPEEEIIWLNLLSNIYTKNYKISKYLLIKIK